MLERSRDGRQSDAERHLPDRSTRCASAIIQERIRRLAARNQVRALRRRPMFTFAGKGAAERRRARGCLCQLMDVANLEHSLRVCAATIWTAALRLAVKPGDDSTGSSSQRHRLAAVDQSST